MRIAETLGLTPATRQALKTSTTNVTLDLAAMMAQPPYETEALRERTVKGKKAPD